MNDLRPVHRAGVRIGDAEREQVATQLSEHYAAGRLSLDEFAERSNLAAEARSNTDLARLLNDLPRMQLMPQRPAAAAPARQLMFDAGVVGLGLLAAMCLMVLSVLGMAGHAFDYVFFGALGGAAVMGSAVHTYHRVRARTRR